MLIGLDARMWERKFGGFSRYLRELAPRLWRIDSKNHYAVFLTEPEFSLFQPPSARVKKIKASSPHYGLREQFLLPRELGRAKIDLCHFPNFNVPVFYGGKFVVTIHDLTSLDFPGPGRDNFIFREGARFVFSRALKRASKIIAVSEDTRGKILKNFSVDESKLTVIREGVSMPAKIIDPEAIKIKYGISKPYIFYSGSWRVHKNIPGLVRAFSVLVKEKGRDLELVLGGWGSENMKREIAASAESGGVEGRLKILTPSVLPDEEIFSLMRGASVVVIPSRAEGFGFLGLETLRASGFVAASDLASLKETLGGAAVFFNPDDPRDMADKISRVIFDDALRQTLRSESRAVLERFDWDKAARETLNLYEKAVG